MLPLFDMLTKAQGGNAMDAGHWERLVRSLALDDAQALLSRLRLVRVVPDTCLYRSLARYSILRRAGHPAAPLPREAAAAHVVEAS